MKVGDRVTWRSSGTEKAGRIVAIVPAYIKPTVGWPAKRTDLRLASIVGAGWYQRYDAKRLGGGGKRDHESYLVAVKTGKTDRAKKSLYWPHVAWLRKVNGDA